MANLKNRFLKKNLTCHHWLGWTGGLALLLFALSGMMHPLMTWTAPQPASLFPPQVVLDAELVAQIPHALKRAEITQAVMIKVVPAESGVLLQVTEHPDQPRRYFDLKSGLELQNYEEQYAIWLARYYTGLDSAPVREVVFQHEFSESYPWVNRLLPVYKITFDTDDHRTAWVYTELSALGSLTNHWKTTIQSVFQWMHTWSWFDEVEHARVLLMMCVLLCLLGMVLTGMAMLFLMNNRKMEAKRKVHRLLAYAIWLPLLMFLSSGMYHLMQSTYGDHHRGMTLNQPIVLSTDRLGGEMKGLKHIQNVQFNGLSLVEGPSGDLLYRFSVSPGKHEQPISMQTRVDGMSIEQPAQYFNAATGKQSEVTDRDMAIYYASKQLGLAQSKVVNAQRVTQFGSYYDFRNKRLPVWQVDYDTERGDILFIDPASGMLVDRVVYTERLESDFFSFFHKWNFLTPWIGRISRDLLMVFILPD